MVKTNNTFYGLEQKIPDAFVSAPLDSLRKKCSVCVFQVVKCAQKAGA